MSKLKIEHISKSFDGVKTIDGISIILKNNEIVSLLGESGVGKSTIFNIISGTLVPDIGNIFLNDTNITGKTGYISYMQQKDLLLPYKKIIDNAALPLIIKGVKKKEARLKALSFFEQFGILGTDDKYPSQLSGGMRQRVALLRTYLFGSEVVLLDEPFSALDSFTKNKMQTWYLNISKEINLSTLFVTHDIDEAVTLSDRIYILEGKPGKIAYEIVIDREYLNNEQFKMSEKFYNYKNNIMTIINSNALNNG
jgi:ABC-type nitrate/sulfonate/bicarbonate transport system ATPase subunit